MTKTYSKKILSVLFALLLCMTAVIPAFAETADMPRLVDNADLLTDDEESELLAKLDDISRRLNADVAVVTENSIGGETPRDYADDFYDYNGYKEDGVLLLLSMEERDWYISTKGTVITAITDARREAMADEFVGYLSDGDYMQAFETYADECYRYIEGVQNGYYDEGTAYDENSGYYDESGDYNSIAFFPWRTAILISLVIGLVAALIVTGFMRGSLKTVRRKAAAADYVRPGSMNVAYAHDVFLYSHVSRTEKPKNTDAGGSATHTSSSGATHGGGGGKF